MLDALPVFESNAGVAEAEAGFGALDTALGPLPLKALEVEGRITGLVTRTRVTQTFVNTHREPLEGGLHLPAAAPGRGHRFTMRVGDRLVTGSLLERQEARDATRRPSARASARPWPRRTGPRCSPSPWAT